MLHHNKIMSKFIISYLLIITAIMIESLGCPKTCRCYRESGFVDCRHTSKKVVPEDIKNPEQVKEFSLYNNFIQQLNFELQLFRNLRYLDLSSNLLTNIEDGAFDGLSKLHTLLLNNNHLSLDNTTFHGLSALIILDLSFNHIREFKENTFMHLPNLQTLNLTGNIIFEIKDATFTGLNSLVVLRLSQNSLQDIPTLALVKMKSLNVLDLSQNRIVSLPEKAFLNQSQLQLLNLAKNSLQHIHDDVFIGLEHQLTKLELQGNKMVALPVQALKKLAQLQELDFSNNCLTVLSTKLFTGLDYLQVLNLNYLHYLERIEASAFDLPRLQEIHLTGNRRLKVIDSNAFVNVPNLKRVFLNNNVISRFSKDLLDWNTLTEIDLSGNRIICDCSASWIIDLFRKNRTEVCAKFLRCSKPLNIAGRDVRSLHSTDFGCEADSKHASAMTLDKLAIGGISSAVTLLVVIVTYMLWHYRRYIISGIQRQFQYKRQKNIFILPQADTSSLTMI